MENKQLDKMFKIVGIKKEDLHNALREMGTKHLKVCKDEWSPEKPTTGYCYVVSEVIYHFLAPEGTKSFRLEIEDGSHWFLKYPDDQIIDLTADQIEGEYDYDKAVKKNFRTKKISKRGKLFATALKLL